VKVVIDRQKISRRIRYTGLFTAVCLLWFGFTTITAQGASSIAQGFKSTDPNVVAGAIVSLKDGSPNTVELANQKNLDNVLGVVSDRSLIELAGSGTVQIVTSGTATTLVSDINGDIKTGDKITSSPISGIGMKATTSTLVIGTAQAKLSSTELKTQTIIDKNGKQQTVKVGAMPIQVDRVFYEASETSYLPPALQSFANAVAGRKVSAVRVLIASVLVLLLFVIVGVLLYSAVRSSIISIGRNPLSERAVRKSLLEVGLTVFGVLVFAAIAVYLLLTL
jgi:hypothetical protein